MNLYNTTWNIGHMTNVQLRQKIEQSLKETASNVIKGRVNKKKPSFYENSNHIAHKRVYTCVEQKIIITEISWSKKRVQLNRRQKKCRKTGEVRKKKSYISHSSSLLSCTRKLEFMINENNQITSGCKDMPCKR